MLSQNCVKSFLLRKCIPFEFEEFIYGVRVAMP